MRTAHSNFVNKSFDLFEKTPEATELLIKK